MQHWIKAFSRRLQSNSLLNYRFLHKIKQIVVCIYKELIKMPSSCSKIINPFRNFIWLEYLGYYITLVLMRKIIQKYVVSRKDKSLAWKLMKNPINSSQKRFYPIKSIIKCGCALAEIWNELKHKMTYSGQCIMGRK